MIIADVVRRYCGLRSNVSFALTVTRLASEPSSHTFTTFLTHAFTIFAGKQNYWYCRVKLRPHLKSQILILYVQYRTVVILPKYSYFPTVVAQSMSFGA